MVRSIARVVLLVSFAAALLASGYQVAQAQGLPCQRIGGQCVSTKCTGYCALQYPNGCRCVD